MERQPRDQQWQTATTLSRAEEIMGEVVVLVPRAGRASRRDCSVRVTTADETQLLPNTPFQGETEAEKDLSFYLSPIF